MRSAVIKKFLAAGIIRGTGAVSLVVLFSLSNYIFDSDSAATLILLVTMSAIITPISLFGFNTLSVRSLSSTTDLESRIKFTVFIFKNISVILMFISLIAAVVFYVYRPFGIGPISVISLFILLPISNISGCCLQGIGRINSAIFFMNICPNMILSIFLIICFLVNIDSPSLFIIEVLFLISSFISAISGLLLLIHIFKTKADETGHDVARINKMEIFQYWVIYVFVALINFLPQMLYYRIGDSSQFVSLATAQKIANVINFILIVSNFIFTPKISFLFSSDKIDELRTSYLRITLVTSIIALLPTVLCFIFSDQIMRFFGVYTIDSGTVLIVFCAAQFFNVATGSSNAVLTMTGNAGKLCIAMITAFAFTILAVLLLSPRLGVVGFACGTALGLSVQNIMAVYYVQKVLRKGVVS